MNTLIWEQDNRKITRYALGGMVASLIIAVLLLSGKEQESELITRVTKHDFKIELNVVGVLDAATSHMISSDLQGANGTIIYLIDDGKWVRKGEVLVRFDRAPFEKEVTKFEAQVESYKAAVKAAEQVVAFEINQVDREIANAKYRLRVATLELNRLQEGDGPLKVSVLKEEQQKVQNELKKYQSFFVDLMALKKKGFDNPSEISSTSEQIAVYKAKLKAATKRYDSYQKNVFPALVESGKAKVQNETLVLQQTKQGGKHKIAKVRAALLQVKGILKSKQAALDKAKFKLKKTVIKAPFHGIVIHYETFRNGQKRKPREGDSVFMNQPILYLPDISRMVVNTKAREIDLHKIELGQQGRIVVDAYPDIQLTGELTFIGALATAEESGRSHEKYFKVTFRVNEDDIRLRPGMTCRVTIRAESVKDVIAIPVQAVFTDDQGNYCFVKKGRGRFERREIVLGRQNEELVEITSGLQTQERVSLVRQRME